MIFLWILLALATLVLLTSFICYRIVFYNVPAPPLGPEEYDIPKGSVYEPYRDQMILWQQQMRRLPHKIYSITSRDGLTLRGNYYEYAPGAVTELMFHGYRGTAERDLCGGVQRAFALGRNVLIVDQRTSGRSGGRTITFGVREHEDCLAWVNLAIRELGPDCRLILTGISMGAATVLMAAGKPLPPNVVGVLADCGYTSAKEIICKCAVDMKLPPNVMYPFIKLGGRLFGHFDVDADSPLEAMKRCTLPVIFFHGDADDFVPCSMSQANFDTCTAPKRLVITPGAAHGLCYMLDPDAYLREVADFFTENGVETAVVL